MNDKELLKLVIDKGEVFAQDQITNRIWRLTSNQVWIKIHTCLRTDLGWVVEDLRCVPERPWTLVPDPSQPQPKTGQERLTWLRSNPGEVVTNGVHRVVCIAGCLYDNLTGTESFTRWTREPVHLPDTYKPERGHW